MNKDLFYCKNCEKIYKFSDTSCAICIKCDYKICRCCIIKGGKLYFRSEERGILEIIGKHNNHITEICITCDRQKVLDELYDIFMTTEYVNCSDLIAILNKL